MEVPLIFCMRRYLSCRVQGQYRQHLGLVGHFDFVK